MFSIDVINIKTYVLFAKLNSEQVRAVEDNLSERSSIFSAGELNNCFC